MTTYTHGHHASVLRAHRWRTAENSCAYLLAHLHPDDTLLDVGCGPGTITADLADRVGEVLGVDPAATVIDEARAAHPGVAFAVADLFELDGRWDVVHAHQVLQHLDDPVGALRAMAARARRLVAARDGDYPAFVWWPDSAPLERWLEVYLAVTRRNGAHADAGRRLLGWAHDAGLHDVTYTTSTWTFATPAERAWWSALWAERCTASAFAEQAVAYGIASAHELAELADGWRAWGADEGSLLTIVHGEIVAGV